MLYIVFLIGLVFIIYGWNKCRKTKVNFQEVLNENDEHLEKFLHYQDIMEKVNEVDKKVNKILDYMDIRENREVKNNDCNYEDSKDEFLAHEYEEVIQKIREMDRQNKSIEEIAAALHMGKGEILFLRNLSKK